MPKLHEVQTIWLRSTLSSHSRVFHQCQTDTPLLTHARYFRWSLFCLFEIMYIHTNTFGYLNAYLMNFYMPCDHTVMHMFLNIIMSCICYVSRTPNMILLNHSTTIVAKKNPRSVRLAQGSGHHRGKVWQTFRALQIRDACGLTFFHPPGCRFPPGKNHVLLRKSW